MRCAVTLTAALCLTAATPAGAQLRYMVTLDVQEQFSSDAFAGVQPEPGAEQQSQPDLITIFQPAVRLYYNWPRNLLYMRYGLRLQLHALVQDANGTQDPADDRLLLGYANRLDLGYNHMFSHRSEVAVINRLRQGSETTSVSGYVGSAGTAQPGLFTAGSKYLAETLRLAYHRQLNRRWSIAPRLLTEAYFPYDRDVLLEYQPDIQSRIIPPSTNVAVTQSTAVRHAFTDIGTLGFTLDLSYLHQYYSADVEQYQGIFPEHLNALVAAASVGWRHQLSQQWDYTLGAGFDVRLREQYEAAPQAGQAAVNLGFQDPDFGPVAEGSIRYRWQRTLSVTLSYAHRTQRLIESSVSTASEVDQVGLDAYWLVNPWRFDLFASFRYMRNTSNLAGQDSQEDLDDTMLVRANASVGYLVRQGVSLELSYNLEFANNAVAFFASCDQITGAQCTGSRLVTPESYDYLRHLVTVGVSLAWPPPPPQDVRFNRRESEYDPVFVRDSAGASDEQEQRNTLDNPDRTEGRQDGSEDPLNPDNDLQRQER